jgi:hypothetical protein
MGRLISSTPLESTLRISRGIVPGHIGINKFGGSPSVASNTTEDVWDGQGTYSFPSTADITHLSMAADQVAMRGETIEVEGLDADWNLVLQTKTLNASNTTTAVALNTALRRVFRMSVLANVVADQALHAKNVGAGITYATIVAGNNQTLMAIYTVPAGKTGFLTNYYADVVRITGADPKGSDFRLWVADRANGYEFQLKHAQAASDASHKVVHHFRPYLVVTEKSDIKITAKPIGAAAEAHAGFDLYLVDN